MGCAEMALRMLIAKEGHIAFRKEQKFANSAQEVLVFSRIPEDAVFHRRGTELEERDLVSWTELEQDLPWWFLDSMQRIGNDKQTFRKWKDAFIDARRGEWLTDPVAGKMAARLAVCLLGSGALRASQERKRVLEELAEHIFLWGSLDQVCSGDVRNRIKAELERLSEDDPFGEGSSTQVAILLNADEPSEA